MCLHRPAVVLALMAMTVSATIPASAASWAAGTVYARQRGRLAPLANATVTAKTTPGARVLAVAETDARGYYQLLDLPAGRVRLSASHAGYFPWIANGLRDSKIVIDCSVEGSCAQIDFQLARAGVINGEVADELGDPLQEIEVSLHRKNSRIIRKPLKTTTDDRGVFRIAGIEPGGYTLYAEQSFDGSPEEISYQSNSLNVTVEEGDEIRGLRVVLRRMRKFQVSGVLRGVTLSAAGGETIDATPFSDSALWWTRKAGVQADGRFAFHNMPEGKYILTLGRKTSGASEGRPATIPLRTLEVDRHMTNVVLEPPPPTGVSGVMKLGDGVPAIPVVLMIAPAGGGGAHSIIAKPPDYEFKKMGFLPGEYGIRNFSSQFYIKGFGPEGELPPDTFRLAAGETRNLEVYLAADFGEVHGRLKQPRASPQDTVRAASHFLVALAGPKRIRSVQADQNGRFRFDRVVPGQYRICAWSDLSEDDVQDEAVWKKGGAAVRRFLVEPGSEVEIDLTAVR